MGDCLQDCCRFLSAKNEIGLNGLNGLTETNLGTINNVGYLFNKCNLQAFNQIARNRNQPPLQTYKFPVPGQVGFTKFYIKGTFWWHTKSHRRSFNDEL